MHTFGVMSNFCVTGMSPTFVQQYVRSNEFLALGTAFWRLQHFCSGNQPNRIDLLVEDNLRHFTVALPESGCRNDSETLGVLLQALKAALTRYLHSYVAFVLCSFDRFFQLHANTSSEAANSANSARTSSTHTNTHERRPDGNAPLARRLHLTTLQRVFRSVSEPMLYLQRLCGLGDGEFAFQLPMVCSSNYV